MQGVGGVGCETGVEESFQPWVGGDKGVGGMGMKRGGGGGVAVAQPTPAGAPTDEGGPSLPFSGRSFSP